MLYEQTNRRDLQLSTLSPDRKPAHPRPCRAAAALVAASSLARRGSAGPLHHLDTAPARLRGPAAALASGERAAEGRAALALVCLVWRVALHALVQRPQALASPDGALAFG